MAEITLKLAANNRRQCFFINVIAAIRLKISTNLLFKASNCHVAIHRQCQFKLFKMAERLGGRSSKALLAPCATKKREQRRMTESYHWIGVQQNTGMFSKL